MARDFWSQGFEFQRLADFSSSTAVLVSAPDSTGVLETFWRRLREAPEQRSVTQEFAPERAPDYYAPTRIGTRGCHPGSFKVAHRLRDSPARREQAAQKRTSAARLPIVV
jgi:hypothetical protein